MLAKYCRRSMLKGWIVTVLVCAALLYYLLRVSRPTSIVGNFIIDNDEDKVQNESINSTVHIGSNLSVQTKISLSDTPIMGHVNYDSWLCEPYIGTTVDDIRIRHDWPNKPTKRQSSDKIQVFFERLLHFGCKQYGYILPPSTGMYDFHINSTHSTAAVNGEFWLSTDSQVTNLVKMLDYSQKRGQSNSKSSNSKEVTLESNKKYYFEFHVKGFKGGTNISVKWRPPTYEEFEEIPHLSLRMAVKLENGDYAKTMLTSSIVQSLTSPSLPSNKLQSPGYKPHVTFNVHKATDLKILPECEFNNKIKWITETSMYPVDANTYTMSRRRLQLARSYRETKKSTADLITELYINAFNSQTQHSGKVIGLHYLEQTQCINSGSRFLLEMDVQLNSQDKPIHTSEYVYFDKIKNSLCHASNFQWQRYVDVHIVVAVKNIGAWVKQFIHNFEEIYRQTKDRFFELIVIDFNSTDVNIEREFKMSSLPRWKIISLKGAFSRSGGLQVGIDYVKNDNSIVITTDLQLIFPPNYLDAVRKHTIKGKLAYCPMFFRLDSSLSENHLVGYWSDTAYGQMGLFKSDWKRIGGFDLKRYTTNWGGEDEDIVSKCHSKGIEVLRMRVPGFFHYYHTKAGYWGTKPDEDATYNC